MPCQRGARAVRSSQPWINRTPRVMPRRSRSVGYRRRRSTGIPARIPFQEGSRDEIYAFRADLFVARAARPHRLRRRGDRRPHRQGRRSDRWPRAATCLVVDTGFWIFGKKRMIPAGVVPRDRRRRANKVFVAMTKDQIKQAPDYDEERHRDRRARYHDEVGRLLRPVGRSTAADGSGRPEAPAVLVALPLPCSRRHRGSAWGRIFGAVRRRRCGSRSAGGRAVGVAGVAHPLDHLTGRHLARSCSPATAGTA